MATDQPGNSPIGITGGEAISVIKSFFESNLPSFRLIEEDTFPPYWKIAFSKDKLAVVIEGDMAFVATIRIDGKDFPLHQFDREAGKATSTNERNLSYTLNAIKRFFENS